LPYSNRVVSSVDRASGHARFRESSNSLTAWHRAGRLIIDVRVRGQRAVSLTRLKRLVEAEAFPNYCETSAVLGLAEILSLFGCALSSSRWSSTSVLPGLIVLPVNAG
jgi:hypothetical protein